MSNCQICPKLLKIGSAQLAFTCSKLIIETPEKGVKYVQSQQ